MRAALIALLLPCALYTNALRCTTHPMMAGSGFGAAKPSKPKGFEGKKTFERQMNAFHALREPGYPPPNQVDVYVHATGSDKFWFVGKCVTRTGVVEDLGLSAVVQKRLVLEHAKLLQPRVLGSAKDLEVWTAPPNSEMRVAQRQQGLRPLAGLKAPPTLGMDECGFLPEQYTAEDREGFYVRLPADGQPDADSSVKVLSPEQAVAGGFLGDLGDLGGAALQTPGA